VKMLNPKRFIDTLVAVFKLQSSSEVGRFLDSALSGVKIKYTRIVAIFSVNVLL